MPRYTDTYQSKYLAAGDLEEAGEVRTIKVIAVEKMMDENRTEKIVLYFAEGGKAMVANKTNCKTIADLYGDNTDDWEGQKITLYPTEVNFKGDMVDAIRVRSKKPKRAVPKEQGPIRPKNVANFDVNTAPDDDDDEDDDNLAF